MSRRHGDIAQASRHGGPQRLRRQHPGRRLRPPAGQHRNEANVAYGIDSEGPKGSSRGNDRAADCRSNTAGDVVPHAVEDDGTGKIRAWHHLPDQGLPCRTVEGGATADQKGEEEQEPRGHEAKIGTEGEADRDDQQENLSREHEFAPVEIVGNGARCQGEQHDRQCGGCLHQGDHVRPKSRGRSSAKQRRPTRSNCRNLRRDWQTTLPERFDAGRATAQTAGVPMDCFLPSSVV